MKFSFRNSPEDTKTHAASSGQQSVARAEEHVEAYPSETAGGASASRTAQPSLYNKGNNEDPRRMGILLFPETQDVKDFWVLYQRISNSGLKCHAGIFEHTADGTWTEQKVE